MQTTLIRDELIAALSLDLPEQARFAAVRAAIGGMVGTGLFGADCGYCLCPRPQHQKQKKKRQGQRGFKPKFGRALGEVTEARSSAERLFWKFADALRILD